jgi:hypothetical protein
MNFCNNNNVFLLNGFDFCLLSGHEKITVQKKILYCLIKLFSNNIFSKKNVTIKDGISERT